MKKLLLMTPLLGLVTIPFIKQSSDNQANPDDIIIPFATTDTNCNYQIQCSCDLVNWHQATLNLDYEAVDLGDYYDIRVHKTNQQMFFRLIPN